MCKEDVRFMRKTKWSQYSLQGSGPSTGNVALKANPDRVAVIASAYTGLGTSLGAPAELYTLDGGMHVTLGTFGDNHSLQLLAAEIGLIITSQLYVDMISTTDPFFIFITEVVLVDELEKL